jgi:hypothetical protein
MRKHRLNLSHLLYVTYTNIGLARPMPLAVTLDAINSKVNCDFHTKIHRFWGNFLARDALTGA